MKIHQLRYLTEIAEHGLNFSNAAASLHTSQPGISQQIRLLEEELGVDLFIRNGSRIVEMTEPGQRIVEIAKQILRQMDDVKAVASEFTESNKGKLVVAATFTFAHYVLPGVFRRFVEIHPEVELALLQGSPAQVAQLVVSGEADIAVTARPAKTFPALQLIDYCKLPRTLLAPRKHPLLKSKRVTLKEISAYPLITLDVGSHGQSKMRETFTKSKLTPRIAFTGVDIDVVKAFVEAGLGIAILPSLAYDSKRDPGLRAVDVQHLFESHTGCLALPKNRYLRGFAFDFIETLAPTLDRASLRRVLGSTQDKPA
jgi:LysR family cys regulon transcriptional activator